MTFTELVASVIELTKRPDLVGVTNTAVIAATLKAHHSDFFLKDILETGIIFDTAEYLQSLDYRTLFPRFRSIKYIRKCDSSTTPPVPLEFLEYLAPENALDTYGQQRTNVYYLAGAEIQIKSLTQEDTYLFACYQHPSVVASNYISWIALENPFAIIYEATATIFKTIGFDEQVSTYRQMVADEYALLKGGNITGDAQ